MTVPTHLLWLVSASICIPVSCVYFPLKTWHVHVPFNFPVNRSLVRVVAARRNEDDAGADWLYAIDNIWPPLNQIQVDPLSGKVFLNSSISFQLAGQNISLTLSARSKINNAKLDTCIGSISFTQGDSSICATPTEQACFLPVPLHVSVYENDPAQVIASFASPLPALCQSRPVQYRISQAVSSYLSVDSTTGEIKTNVPLDREDTAFINFTISCDFYVSGVKRNFSRSSSVIVVDVNDNPPVLFNGGQMDVYLDKQLSVGLSLPLSSQIILKDKDNERSSYSYEMFGDVEDLFEIELVDMKIVTNERGFYKKADIKVKRKLEFKGESYALKIIFEDDDMPATYTDRKAVFNLVIHNKTIKSAISSQYNETISSAASKYTKLLGPLLKHLGKHDPDFLFTIEVIQPELKGIFNVTPLQGIVYLQDPSKLPQWRNMSIKVRWVSESSPNMDNFTWININITPSEKKNQCDGATSCAVNKNTNACVNACGRGSGQGTCQWLNVPVSRTCVANTRTCPDGECDELESLDWNICPQDCAEHVVPQSCKGEHGRGMSVSSVLGVFSCDALLRKCSCFEYSTADVDADNERNGRRTTNAHSTGDANSNLTAVIPRVGSVATFDAVESDVKCDSNCVALIALGVCLPVMFSLLFFTWYMRRLKVRAGRPKYLGSAMSLSAVPSDYVDERSSSVVSQAISVNDTLLAGPPKLHVPIDSKWEFPRNQLIIEQTLGEGEFGRVMRAKAFGINGNPGFSTVAIKMLKNNGTNSELQDLLSEYNLLKEVSHQNVIKLLGACTDKGGPFYIIAEYAEHGSLRHYLRKSRQLEFDTYTSEDSGVGSLLLAPTTSSGSSAYQISPADLLSFMWQISKGMAYLSEMKVVHRDLATRNILIATDKVVKISDFGLSRDIYEGDAYFKRSKGRVPVKWMAIESLINHIYTSKSDVWSFGIVMWEIVMLGSMPYPGVPPERLFYLLKSGYRMEKPDNCSDELYKIMMLCWKDNPHERPHFKELTNKLDLMLQDKVEYLDLGFNIVHNMTYFEDHQDDVGGEDSDSDDHDYGSLNALPNNNNNNTLKSMGVRSEGMEDTLTLPVASTSQSHDSNVVVIAEAVV